MEVRGPYKPVFFGALRATEPSTYRSPMFKFHLHRKDIMSAGKCHFCLTHINLRLRGTLSLPFPHIIVNEYIYRSSNDLSVQSCFLRPFNGSLLDNASPFLVTYPSLKL